MARWWTRSQQRKYKAQLVTDRLMGKKEIDPDVEAWAWLNCSQAISPYLYSTLYKIQTPRTSFIISGMEGV